MADTRLFVPGKAWLEGLSELHRRGRDTHESGAFLLGAAASRSVTMWVYYDDLDPAAYSSGVCVLYGEAFERLWSICRSAGLKVLADVHTHPGSPVQSSSDRKNPMIAVAGHLALIVPNFATGPHWRHRLGLYRYEGEHRWTNLSGWGARRELKTGTFR
jgi:proteasome lid subunit RPN8/RPN11